MPEKTIAILYYTAQFTDEDTGVNAGDVFTQGQEVDLSEKEAARGDKLNAFTDSPGLASLAHQDIALSGTLGVNALADQATLDQVRLAVGAGDMERVKELVQSSGTQEQPSDERMRSVVESGTVEEVKGVVGNDPDLAEQAMTYEEQRDKPREGLTSHLQRIIDRA